MVGKVEDIICVGHYWEKCKENNTRGQMSVKWQNLIPETIDGGYDWSKTCSRLAKKKKKNHKCVIYVYLKI